MRPARAGARRFSRARRAPRPRLLPPAYDPPDNLPGPPKGPRSASPRASRAPSGIRPALAPSAFGDAASQGLLRRHPARVCRAPSRTLAVAPSRTPSPRPAVHKAAPTADSVLDRLEPIGALRECSGASRIIRAAHHAARCAARGLSLGSIAGATRIITESSNARFPRRTARAEPRGARAGLWLGLLRTCDKSAVQVSQYRQRNYVSPARALQLVPRSEVEGHLFALRYSQDCSSACQLFVYCMHLVSDGATECQLFACAPILGSVSDTIALPPPKKIPTKPNTENSKKPNES